MMLNNVVADAHGNGSSTTVLADVDGGIPATGWYVNVHNGPMLTSAAQATAIACGNVSNAKHAMSVAAALGATTGANQSASGGAGLALKKGVMAVVVIVTGLVPGSSHAVHIHAGSCGSQGGVVFMLANLVADKHGKATSITVIKGVKEIPDKGWYVNVHFSTDLTNQTGFDPIACGNVSEG